MLSLLARLVTLLASLAALVLSTTGGTPPGPASLHVPGTNVSTLSANASADISRNWSGYAATSGTFTSVAGTWTVPRVNTDGQVGADATWIGIGGVDSRDLIQSGTRAVIDRSGQVTYSAFIEMLPRASREIAVTINQGDSVTISIARQATNQWQISFKDNTNGQTFRTTVTYRSSLSSAEWIEEAPSSGRAVLPLDNFGTLALSNGSTTKDGKLVSIASSGAQPITMVNVSRQALATPSALGSDGASFTVTRSSVSSYPAASPFGGRGYGVGPSQPFPRPYRRNYSPWSP